MKTRITVVLLFLATGSFGQKYGNIWQFGYHVEVNFNACDPVASNRFNNNSGFEGCSTISDANGQLLFYTNSDSVWNHLGQAMPNGHLISSSGTLSQVIIIPKPLSDSLYYVVTTKIQASGSLNLRYHVVNMNLDLGFGDVVSSNNVLTSSNITEQIAATYHSDGTDIWLMAHEYGTNNFLAFLVTSSGISPAPVISGVGPAHVLCNSSINARGEIKFSPDGNKIAFNGNGVGGNDPANILAIFDFDKTTGVVSNPINLPFSRGDFGLSFSPDNSKLYGTTWKALNFTASDYNYIYQFDLSSGMPSTIINSKQIIDSVQIPTSYGDIKIGPDGKIYVARYNSAYLGVINNPDLAGSACNYIPNGLYLEGKTSQYGLNNYIEYSNYCNPSTYVQTTNQPINSITVFPNPSSGYFTIAFSDLINNGTVEVYNLLGEKIAEDIISSATKKEINLKNTSPGIYFMKICEGEKQFARKIVIE
jgi:hypothetical protein